MVGFANRDFWLLRDHSAQDVKRNTRSLPVIVLKFMYSVR